MLSRVVLGQCHFRETYKTPVSIDLSVKASQSEYGLNVPKYECVHLSNFKLYNNPKW